MTRSLAHNAHTVVAWLFVVCCVVQVFLAGLGVFDDPGAFITHREFGYAFGWLTLVLLLLAVVGRMGRRQVSLAVLMFGLLALQSVLVALRVSYPGVAALHPLNGFALLFVAISAARLSWATRPGRADDRRVATEAV
jgi:hypothetical protein